MMIQPSTSSSITATISHSGDGVAVKRDMGLNSVWIDMSKDNWDNLKVEMVATRAV